MAVPRFYQIRRITICRAEIHSIRRGALTISSRGLVAISATSLQGVYFAPPLHDAWTELLKHCRLVDVVGYSIFIYQFKGFDDKN